jgi:hypothetical protein
MNLTLRAVSGTDFDNWVTATKQTELVLDRPTYETLEHPSQNVAPFTYRASDPVSFQAIVTQMVPPGFGPNAVALAGPVQPTSEK